MVGESGDYEQNRSHNGVLIHPPANGQKLQAFINFEPTPMLSGYVTTSDP